MTNEDGATKKREDADVAGGGVSGGVPGEGERAALEVVKTLLACGADHGAFVVDSTPLHMAALGGATDVVDALMEAGADADARAPNGYTTPLEAAARYAADIILDRRDEREARAYRRSVAGYVDDARRRGDDAARAAALDVLDAYDDYDPYGDDSDDDSFDDGALDELASGEYDDDDEGWYDDETGDAFASGTGGARGSRRFGSSSRGSSALRGNRRALGSKPKRSSRGGYDRASR